MFRHVIGARVQPDEGEKFVRTFLYRCLLRPGGCVACDRAPHTCLSAHMATDHHIFDCGKIGEQANILKRAGDAECCNPVRRQFLELLALKCKCTFVKRVKAREHIE